MLSRATGHHSGCRTYVDGSVDNSNCSQPPLWLAQDEDAMHDEGRQGEEDQLQPGEEEADSAEWVKMNKKFRTKSGLWAASQPGPRLLLLSMTIQSAEKVMHRFLDMSGYAWDVRQRLKAMRGRRAKIG